MKTKNLLLIAALFMSLLLFGCSDHDNDSASGTVPGDTGDVIDSPIVDSGTDDETVSVGAIAISANTSTIRTFGTATITVALFSDSGQTINTSKEVVFTLDNPALGVIPSPIDVTGGSTSQVFGARGNEGVVTITATCEGKSATQAIEISDQDAAASVDVVATPDTVNINGTISVAATVLNGAGDPMPSTSVAFSVGNTNLGTIDASASTDANGVATATFSAGATAGSTSITATTGTIQNSTTITVTAADIDSGSIEFSSATPQVIVIRGAGGQETSQVQFLVKDANGDPAASRNVLLELSGPNGGEYLGSVPGTQNLTVGTVNGIASVILHSGTIPGTVTITASVEGTTLSTSSGVIAIGGGVPSEGHFSLSAVKLNIEGGYLDNVTTNITSLIADRYGNYNVLQGTSVSFYSECGAIDRAVALDAIGQGTVTFRTQTPRPQDVDPDPFGTPAGSGSCGEYCDIENQIVEDFDFFLGVDITADPYDANPRDGLCTIVSVVDGEEEFTDNNANGAYDSGEPFVDSYDDIHLDMDDDSIDIAAGAEVDGNPYDADFGGGLGEDLIVDRNGDGLFNGKNTSWDSNKRITKRIDLLYTGVPGLTLSENIIAVPNGSSQTIYFALHDGNYNRPVGGTTLKVAFSGNASMTGSTDITYLDSNGLGTPIYGVTLTDSDPATNETTLAEMEFTWNWLGNEFSILLGGTTDAP